LAGASFIAAEIAEIDKLMSQQETLYTGKQWRQMRLTAGLIGNLVANGGGGRLTTAEKLAKRRAEYDTERKKIDAPVAAVQALGKPAAAALAAIQQKVKEADAMASHATLQIEEAKAALPAIAALCKSVDSLVKEGGPYTKERAAVATDLSKLREHPAAAKIKAELDVIRGVLDEAAQLAGDKGAPGTPLAIGADPALQDIAAARVRLAQAKANLATAKGLADGLGGAAAVENLVGDKPNMTSLRKGLDALIAELATAKNAEDAKLATAEFEKVQEGIDEAKKQIDAKDTAAATKAIAGATDRLAAGRRIQVQHGDFLERRKLLQSRLDQYNADKALAAKVKLKLDELAKAVKAADVAETAGDQALAMAELNKGEAAAGAGRQRGDRPRRLRQGSRCRPEGPRQARLREHQGRAEQGDHARPGARLRDGLRRREQDRQGGAQRDGRARREGHGDQGAARSEAARGGAEARRGRRDRRARRADQEPAEDRRQAGVHRPAPTPASR
jgi:hypothetical protein